MTPTEEQITEVKQAIADWQRSYDAAGGAQVHPLEAHEAARQALDAAVVSLAQRGASARERLNGFTRFRFGGVTATSTGGMLRALGNWLTQVDRRKLEGAEQ